MKDISYSSIFWGHFLNLGSLLSDVSNLYRVDIKLASITLYSSVRKGNIFRGMNGIEGEFSVLFNPGPEELKLKV